VLDLVRLVVLQLGVLVGLRVEVLAESLGVRVLLLLLELFLLLVALVLVR
jgi:hypothetical protein